MARIKTNPLGRRVMALFLATIMCVSLVQISAFATGETSAQQIVKGGGTSYYTAAGKAATAENYDVAVTKTIAGTATENVFDVTTKMEYRNSSTKVTNKNAAVVLVIDTSGSMDWCAQCGKDLTSKDHKSKEEKTTIKDVCPGCVEAVKSGSQNYTTYVRQKQNSSTCKNCGQDKRNYVDVVLKKTVPPVCSGTQSRLDAAKVSAAAFVESFAQAGCVRKVAVVTFATSATQKLGWTDVSTADGKKTVKDTINGLTADGGTNTEDGMNNAAAYLKEDAIQKTENCFCVLLTDGQPTYNKSYSLGGNNGDATTVFDTLGAQAGCKEVTDTGASLYAIAYGMSGDTVPVYDESAGLWNGYTRMSSVTDWLKNDCGAKAAYTPSNATDLTTAFNTILQSSVSTGATGSAKADTINDGNGTAIQFVEFNNANGATYDKKTPNVIDMDNVAADTSKTGYTSYTTTYQVRLNNTISGFDPDASYSLGAASMTFTNASAATDETSHTAVSPKPAVKGYLGGFSFQKRASGDTGETATIKFESNPATFTLYSDKDCKTVVTTSSTNNNTVTFSGIPSGATYYMKETNAPEGFQKDNSVYTVSVSYGVTTVTHAKGNDTVTDYNSAVTTNMMIVDKYDPKNVPVTVNKTWQDNGSNSRPDITIRIWKQNEARDDAAEKVPVLKAILTPDPADVEVLSLSSKDSNVTKNGSTWTLTSKTELPSVDETTGEKITYYAKEDAVNGYRSSNVNFAYDNEQTAATVTATNTRTGTHDITVNKVWVAPKAESEAKINVLQNGSVYKTVALNANNKWTATLEKAPTYDQNGKEYAYSVQEVGATNRTITYGSGSNAMTYSVSTATSDKGFTVTNTIQQSAVTINGTKVWKDGNSTSRTSVTMELFADGKATGITTTVSGTDSTEAYSFSKDGNKNLPKYALVDTVGNASITNDGHEIAYTVKEQTKLGGDYKTADDGTFSNNYQIVNQLVGTTSVYVKKAWNAPEDFFGTTTDATTGETTANAYPEINVQLYRNGKATDNTVTLDGQNDEWKHTFSNLAKYDENGALYTYTVKEQNGSDYTSSGAVTVGGKAMSVTLTGSGTETDPYVLTNSAVGTTSVTGTKTWVDGSNAQNTRPESVTLQLVRDGSDVDGKTVTLTSDNVAAGNVNVWNYTFADLPAYNGATPYIYTVREVSPAAKYDVSYSADHLNITNTIKQENVTVYGEKVWVDGDNAQNTRKDATISLMKGDTVVDTKTIQSTDTGEALKFQFANLNKYDVTGAVITYTLSEASVNDYTTSLAQKDGVTANTSTEENPFVITNTYSIPTTQVAVSKAWVDGGKNHSNDSVTVQLLCNDKAVTGETCTLTAANNWTDNTTFANLPTLSSDYKTKYTYTVKETAINPIDSKKSNSQLSDYTVTYDGGAITNKLTAIDTAKAKFEVYKNWIGPVPAGVDSVTAVLGRTDKGEVTKWTQDVTVSKQENGSWSGKATNLQTLDGDGYAYTYFIKEEKDAVTASDATTYTVGGHTYDVAIDDHTITNTIRQEQITVKGTKSWTGGTTEKSVGVRLLLNNQQVGKTQTVNAENDWKYGWQNLDAYTFVKDSSGKITSVTTNAYQVEEVGAKSNGNGTYAVQYGDNHYTVAYTTDKNGDQNIQNTWTSTDTYAYQIDRVYHHYQDGTLNNTVNKPGNATSATKNAAITVNTASWPTTDTMTGYTLVGATLKKNTDGAAVAEKQTVNDGKFSFHTADPNVTYVVTLTYAKHDTTPYIPPVNPNPPVIVPDQPTPGTDIPSTETPTTDIPDVETPTTEKPTTKPTKPTTEIPDDKTPLANTPKTGDALAAWLTAAVASGAGLAWLAISAKKRKEDSAQ